MKAEKIAGTTIILLHTIWICATFNGFYHYNFDPHFDTDLFFFSNSDYIIGFILGFIGVLSGIFCFIDYRKKHMRFAIIGFVIFAINIILPFLSIIF